MIDFVGDKITVNLDSLSVLNSQFDGTPIEIDFDGGKEHRLGCDRGHYSTVAAQRAERPVDHRRRQWQFSGHDLKIHSSSDIVNEADGVQITSNGDIEIKSDSRVAVN